MKILCIADLWGQPDGYGLDGRMEQMGKIFYIMGKSSSGKDSIYRQLEENQELGLKRLVIYTTRPIRDGEKNGREYFFTDKNKLKEFRRNGKLIEAQYLSDGLWPVDIFYSG